MPDKIPKIVDDDLEILVKDEFSIGEQCAFEIAQDLPIVPSEVTKSLDKKDKITVKQEIKEVENGDCKAIKQEFPMNHVIKDKIKQEIKKVFSAEDQREWHIPQNVQTGFEPSSQCFNFYWSHWVHPKHNEFTFGDSRCRHCQNQWCSYYLLQE